MTQTLRNLKKTLQKGLSKLLYERTNETNVYIGSQFYN